MKNERQKLTIDEALAQGYASCGKDSGDRWQSLMTIEHLSEDDFKYNTILVASKELINPSIDKESVADTVADLIHANWYDESGDDTDTVYDKVKEVDFEAITDAINEKLSTYGRYELLNIEIIPNATKNG